MGRAPCCDKQASTVKKGPWTPDEDLKLVTYIQQHGHGSWRALPAKAGLARCGKSCRLRWTNYLRPDIKRGRFSLEEEQAIFQLHAILGNRWSAIASRLPRRTDNEIKNYWNTHLKKRLMDPKPMQDLQVLQSPPARLTHMTQWDLTLAAFFMSSWKSKLEDDTKFGPVNGPVKLEPLFSPLNAVAVLRPDTVLEAACTTVSIAEPEGRSFSPTSILDSDVHSPSGSTISGTSDCFDLILHQSSCYPEPRTQTDTFWERQQMAMMEALQPDSGLVDADAESGLDPIFPLDFDEAEFASLCQGAHEHDKGLQLLL